MDVPVHPAIVRGRVAMIRVSKKSFSKYAENVEASINQGMCCREFAHTILLKGKTIKSTK